MGILLLCPSRLTPKCPLCHTPAHPEGQQFHLLVILGPLDGKSTQRWQLLCEPSPAPWAWDGQRARFGDCPCALVSPLRPESCSLSPVLDIGWQPKCWHGLREVPWAGGDFGTALMALAPPSCSQDSSVAVRQLCLPTLAVCICLDKNCGVSWGSRRRMSPGSLPRRCLCCVAAVMAWKWLETSSATQLRAEPYWGRLIPA